MGFNKKFFTTGGIVAASAAAPLDPLQNFETVTYTGNGGTQKITGYIRKGAAFNGSSSKIVLSNSVFSPSAFTVAAWCNVSTTGAENSIFEFTDTNSGNNQSIVLLSAGNASNSSRFLIRNTTSNEYSHAPSGTPATGWNHYCLTFDGSTAKSYINGSEVNSASFSITNTIASTSEVLLGLSATDRFLNGKIDQVRIFNKAISGTNVATLAAETYASSTKSTTDIFSDGGGVALYELDEGANDTGGNYNGTATNIDYLGMAFQPDFVWIKDRDTSGNSHRLVDSVRLATKALISNGNFSELTETTGLTSFDSNGFTLGNNNAYTNSTKKHVAWCWYAPTSESIGASGSRVASTVKKNVDAGFSIVTFTCPSSNQNFQIGHGLGVKPDMVIMKKRNATHAWLVWHKDLSAEINMLFLDQNLDEAGITQDDRSWGQQSFTDTTISTSTGYSYDANDTVVSYCFANIAGYQKLGSYTGGGASNVTVNLDFSPRFVMIKRATGGNGNWVMYDNVRQTGSVPYDNYSILLADDSYQEQADNTIRGIQFTSTGIVLNQNYVLTNNSGDTYIYWAIA